MYERSFVNVKVERVSTVTFTLDLPYTASILFTQIKVTQNVSFGAAWCRFSKKFGSERTRCFKIYLLNHCFNGSFSILNTVKL